MAKNAAPVAEAEAPAEDLSVYLTKEPTTLQGEFADWIIAKTGKTFKSKAEEAAWRDGVRISVALRMKFQASPENQAVRSRAVTADKVKAAQAEKATAQAAKPAKAAKAAPAPVAAPVVETPAAPKAAKRGGKGNKAPF